MSAGILSNAMTAQAPAASAILACSGDETSMITPPLSICARTLKVRNVPFSALAVDGEGMRPDLLRKSGASVCFLTPSNQFPLGTVTSIGRRHRLLEWVAETRNRYLVEDDYDSDYRYSLRPVPALHSLDHCQRVVYLNTFARTLAPSLRIAYLALPPRLLDAYHRKRRFYSCTVSGFEQQTLRRFLEGGHYERHLNRMRTVYKRRRNAFLKSLSSLARQVETAATATGLHLLLRSRMGMTEAELIERAAAKNVRVYGLSAFHHNSAGETHSVVAGYGGVAEDDLLKAAALLCRAWR